MDRRSYLSLLSGLGFATVMFAGIFVLTFLLKFLTTGRLLFIPMSLFTALGVAGYYLIQWSFPLGIKDIVRPKGFKSYNFNENDFAKKRQQVLLLASSSQGKVTASEVAKLTGLGLVEATTLLKDMVREGLAEVWVTDRGGLVYAFKEFFPDFKSSARDPFVVTE